MGHFTNKCLHIEFNCNKTNQRCSNSISSYEITTHIGIYHDSIVVSCLMQNLIATTVLYFRWECIQFTLKLNHGDGKIIGKMAHVLSSKRFLWYNVWIYHCKSGLGHQQDLGNQVWENQFRKWLHIWDTGTYLCDIHTIFYLKPDILHEKFIKIYNFVFNLAFLCPICVK